MTTRQIYKQLDELTSPEEKAAFLAMSKFDFVCEQHFGLGMWIRNNFIYGLKDASEIASEKDLDHIFDTPDEISARILEGYYEHLKRKVRK